MSNPIVNLSPFAGAGAQFFDSNGIPLAGGLLYTYQAGSTTNQVTYTTPSATVANSNPIVLDSSGRTPQEIWLLNGYSYKFVLQTSAGVQIGSYDNIPSTSTNSAIINDASSVSYEQGYTVTAGNFIVGDTYVIASIGTTNFTSIGAASNTVGLMFTATGVGSGTGTAKFSRSAQSRLQDFVSVKDFGATGNAVYNSGTSTWSGTDDTAAIQAALNSGYPIHIPTGNYLVSSTLTFTTTGVTSGVIRGEGPDKTVLVSSVNGYTILGNFVFDVEGIAIQGITNVQASCVTNGINLWNATSHNWRLKNCYFQYLNIALRTSEAWIGEVDDVYCFDCGSSSAYAISLENATNQINFNNLQLRNAYGGVGPGPNGQWAGQQLYVGPGTSPSGGAGSTCYGINFVNLGIEHIGLSNAANFNSPVTILGGYWENSNYPGDYNKVTFNSNATLIGGFWNCNISITPPSNVNFIGSALGTEIGDAGNFIGGGSYRGSINLNSNNTFIPFAQQGAGYSARLGGPGNFQSQTIGSTPSGLDYYYSGSYTAVVVADGYFNSQSLRMTNTGTADFGGAIGLPYTIGPTSRADVFGWAVVKISDSTDQVVLSLGGPDSNQPGKSFFGPLTANTWYLITIGPENPYDSYLWVRMYGSGGGPPTSGTQLTIDSWGVSFGSLVPNTIYTP